MQRVIQACPSIVKFNMGRISWNRNPEFEIMNNLDLLTIRRPPASLSSIALSVPHVDPTFFLSYIPMNLSRLELAMAAITIDLWLFENTVDTAIIGEKLGRLSYLKFEISLKFFEIDEDLTGQIETLSLEPTEK